MSKRPLGVLGQGGRGSGIRSLLDHSGPAAHRLPPRVGLSGWLTAAIQSLELLGITKNFLEFDSYDACYEHSGVLGGPGKSWEGLGSHRESWGGPRTLLTGSPR